MDFKEATVQLTELTTPGKEDFSKAIALLKSLESASNVTEEGLRTSGLNVVLNGLRKHENKELAAGVKAAVSAFKAALGIASSKAAATVSASASTSSNGVSVTPGVKRKETETDSSSTTSSSSASSSAIEGNNHAKEAKVDETTLTSSSSTPAKSLSIDPNSSSSSSSSFSGTPAASASSPCASPPVAETPRPEVKVGETGDADRNKAQSALFTALGADSAHLRAEIAVGIEEALFRLLGEGKGGAKSADYRSRVRTILANLRDEHNPDFNRRLLSGQVGYEEVVTMDEADMASDAMKKQRDEAIRHSIDSRRTDWDKESGAGATDEFKCHKCKKRRCTYYQKQTRSADEPMTTFITCLECGYRWREY